MIQQLLCVLWLQKLERHSQVVCLGRTVPDPPTSIIPKDRELCFITIHIGLVPSARTSKTRTSAQPRVSHTSPQQHTHDLIMLDIEGGPHTFGDHPELYGHYLRSNRLPLRCQLPPPHTRALQPPPVCDRARGREKQMSMSCLQKHSG